MNSRMNTSGSANNGSTVPRMPFFRNIQVRTAKIGRAHTNEQVKVTSPAELSLNASHEITPASTTLTKNNKIFTAKRGLAVTLGCMVYPEKYPYL